MDYKEMVEGIKANAQQTLEEVKSLKEQLSQREAEINNLDASIKEQQNEINELKAMRQENNITFGQAFREAFYAQKDAIASFVKDKKEKFALNVELKAVGSIASTDHINPNLSLSVQGDNAIYGAIPVSNAFILAFGLKTRTASKLSWVESTSVNNAAYVAELGSATASDITFAEKQRAYGKIATKLTISTEVEDWFDQIYQYCVTEGARLVENKLDAEIYGGDGNDSTQPNHIYGVKGAATAFAALNAGGVEKANIADVIIDAAEQIAKNGFAANVAFVSWKEYAALKEVKTTTGEYLFDRAMGMLNGIKVMPTSKVADAEMLIADTTCAEVFAGNSYELEFIRNGEVDGYNVYFRKAAQVKVPASKAKGLIYVANSATAIAALLKSE